MRKYGSFNAAISVFKRDTKQMNLELPAAATSFKFSQKPQSNCQFDSIFLYQISQSDWYSKKLRV